MRKYGQHFLISQTVIGGIVDALPATAENVVEIGPGKTLKNMIGKIDPSVACYTVSDLPTLLKEVSSS